jgi:hypothetical protein
VKIEERTQATADKKPTREEEVDARTQSQKEDDIVREADMAIRILQEEGTAVAFPEVFEQIRNDMVHVSKRLFRTDTGKETQAIEEDIIATLKEMIEALKRAREENQEQQERNRQQQQPRPPQDPNAKRNLIDMLAELKMIKALQIRVYNRTVLWGRRYPGEQAQTPDIVTELRDLAQRQLRLHIVTNNIAKGKNQ